MPQNLIGVPENSEVWTVGARTYLVYWVPNSDPPVPLAWLVPDVASKTALGLSTTRDRVLSQEEFNRTGVLYQGTTDEIPNPGEGVHPFDSLVDEFETEAQVKPWLRDPEILALWSAAAVEGRSITPAELQTTEWWRTHSAAERSWISLNASDPATAQQRIDDNRLRVSSMLRGAGVAGPSQKLVNTIADNWTQGAWTDTYAATQINALADPLSGVELDPSLSGFTQEVTTTRENEERVRSLVNRWLGPTHAGGWSKGAVEHWAGQLRNNPNAETELTEMLRNQRLALFPGYENPNLTYEDIAGPWRGIWQQTWGEIPDETDPLFTRIVRLNDVEEASKILREKGVEKGKASVVNDLLTNVDRSFGGAVRRAI